MDLNAAFLSIFNVAKIRNSIWTENFIDIFPSVSLFLFQKTDNSISFEELNQIYIQQLDLVD